MMLVDGHVHFHRCFDAARFLDAAASNFVAAAGSPEGGGQLGMLMLTEARGEHAFARLREALEAGSVAEWTARPTDEAASVTAVHHRKGALILVAGRQVTTREGIEVLAYNVAGELGEGAAIEDVLHAIWAARSIAIIPWGFGKWWGRRGRVVRTMLERYRDRPLMLGDNAGRPQLSTSPALFRLARSYRMAIVPGTDPLPFPSEIAKVGRYGFVLRGGLDRNRPGAAAVEALSGAGSGLEWFGTRERLLRFARLQMGMQWRMRIAPAAR